MRELSVSELDEVSGAWGGRRQGRSSGYGRSYGGGGHHHHSTHHHHPSHHHHPRHHHHGCGCGGGDGGEKEGVIQG